MFLGGDVWLKVVLGPVTLCRGCLAVEKSGCEPSAAKAKRSLEHGNLSLGGLLNGGGSRAIQRPEWGPSRDLQRTPKSQVPGCKLTSAGFCALSVVWACRTAVFQSS